MITRKEPDIPSQQQEKQDGRYVNRVNYKVDYLSCRESGGGRCEVRLLVRLVTVLPSVTDLTC